MKLIPTDYIWFNGDYVAWDDARVHVLTPSLHYGWGVYEGIRCYQTDNGPAVFRLHDHLERLRDSARVYFMELSKTDDELAEIVVELISMNGLSSCYIRPIVYLGYGTMGVAPDVTSTQIAIAAWPWESYYDEELETRGARIVVSNWTRNAHHGVPPLAKSTGAYVNSALAKAGALRSGYDDALFLNGNGHLTEASASSLFIVRDGTLITPPLGEALLVGITRDSIIHLAKMNGISIVERMVPRSEIYVAEEAFLAGTAVEIVPIAEVDDRRLKCPAPGPITHVIQDLYRSAVSGRLDAVSQWLSPVGSTPAIRQAETLSASQ